MKTLLFILALLVSLEVSAQTTEVMSQDKINLTEDVSKPTAVVDEFGNVSYKYPKGYNKGSTTEIKPNKNKEVVKEKKPSFIKAKDTGHSIALEVSTFGTLPGATLGYAYQSGHLVMGLTARYYTYEVTSLDEIYSFYGATAKLGYSFYPRWYSHSSSKTVINPTVYLIGGYLSGSSDLENKMSGPLVGVGGSIAYPLNPKWAVTVGMETLYLFGEDSSGNLGNSGTIGVIYSW